MASLIFHVTFASVLLGMAFGMQKVANVTVAEAALLDHSLQRKEANRVLSDANRFLKKVLPATPAQANPSNSGQGGSISVISFNMAEGMGVTKDRSLPVLQRHLPADLIGIQEIPDGGDHRAIQKLGLANYGTYQSEAKNWPHTNPAPIAWNKLVFREDGAATHKQVGWDQHGKRVIEYIRLIHKSSGRGVVFANTHGPVGCKGQSAYDRAIADVLREKMQPKDAVFVAGDFNCGEGQLWQTRQLANRGKAGSGIDFVFSNVGGYGQKHSGSPSDHDLVKGTFQI
jgi:hypothetical protein